MAELRRRPGLIVEHARALVSQMHGLERWTQQAKTPLYRRPTQGPRYGMVRQMMNAHTPVPARGEEDAEEHSDCRAERRTPATHHESRPPSPLQNEAGPPPFPLDSASRAIFFCQRLGAVLCSAARTIRCVPRRCVLLSTTLRTRSLSTSRRGA
jgi:hypothetical protein